MAELVDRPAAGPVCVVHEAPVAARGEARARAVTLLTFVMMVGELVWGWHTNSLGLISDGWHMATHVGALGLTGVAYWYARTRAHQTEFAFGTGKVFALAGYTSAGLLLAVSRALYAQQVQVIRSEVHTIGDRVVDRFRVAELDGTPVAPERRLEIQVAVLSAAEPAKRLSTPSNPPS